MNEPRILRQNMCGPKGKTYLAVSPRVDGRSRTSKVHRLVLDAFVGPKPPGTECCHGPGGRYDNRLENLRWGTPIENTADKADHGTRTPFSAPPVTERSATGAYRRGSACTTSKLDDGQAAEIKRRRRNGEGPSALAREFNVSPQLVCDIHYGRAWKHLVVSD